MSRGERPIPGRQYIVRNGDDGETLEDIGTEAYGTAGQGPKIWGANPHVSATKKLTKGTVLVIPGERPATVLKGKAPDEVTCIVGGRSIRLLNAKIVRTMDTGSDGWAGRIAWTPGADPALDEVIKPFGYPRCAIYIGNRLIVSGCLYGVEPEMTAQGRVVGLTGYSFTADAIDSSMPTPYEYNNVALKQVADNLLPRLGIKGVFESDFGGAFSRVTASEGDTIFSFLAKLTAQRGGLVSCTPEGDMLFLRAKTRGKPVGTLEEGAGFVVGWKASYNGRELWHGYKCITAGVKGRGKAVTIWGSVKGGKVLPSTITEIDDAVPRSRFITFRADDVTPGNVQNAARWRRNKQYVEALTIPFPVTGWYDPNGDLWDVNTLVTVISPTLRVPHGYTFLVRSVEFEGEPNRQAATLYLVPPEAYNSKDLGKIWK